MITLGTAFKNQWNFESEFPNGKHPHTQQLKTLLKRKENRAESAILELDDFGKPYTVDDIAEKIDMGKRSTSFKEYSNKLISQLKRAGKNGNARAYQDAQTAFLKFNKGKDIDLKNIATKTLQKFENHLLEKGLKVNSISVYLRTLRAIYNKAIKEDIVNEKYYPFKNFKIKKEATIKRALTKKDIKRIIEIDLSGHKDLDLARDIFLFSFFNRGMNFIDVCYLTNEITNNGRIIYRRQKTKQTFTIKITEQTRGLIEKYRSVDPGDFLFPILKKGHEYISYRTGVRSLNRKLKKVGEKLELNIPLTSYVARHSWATIAKRSGISTAIISEGLGHESELTTQIYLDSFENETLDDANDIITSFLD